jgi:Cys-rich repeat protein
VIWAKRIGFMLLLSFIAFAMDYIMHKPAGDYCKSPSECRSRLCASGGYCTKRCRSDADCPNGFQCRESRVFTNKLESELAAQGADLKSGKLEKLCLQ